MDDIDFVCTVGGNQIMAGGFAIKTPQSGGLGIMQAGGDSMRDDKPSIFDNLAVPAGLMSVTSTVGQHLHPNSKYLHTNSRVISDDLHDKLFSNVNGISRRGKQTKKHNAHSPLKTTKKRKP